MSQSLEFTDQADQEPKKEILDDNARKFIVNSLDPGFLKENNATSFIMTTDWLETGEDNEKKLAYKKFENGDIQIVLIAKSTKNGNRTSEKEMINEAQYASLLEKSVRRLEKRRYELTYIQNKTEFTLKYDEFANSQLRILEVDAPTEDERNSFNAQSFPAVLSEVTGDLRYYGYRVADTV